MGEVKIPKSIQEALHDKNWVQAINEERGALKKNQIWELVDTQYGF